MKAENRLVEDGRPLPDEVVLEELRAWGKKAGKNPEKQKEEEGK